MLALVLLLTVGPPQEVVRTDDVQLVVEEMVVPEETGPLPLQTHDFGNFLPVETTFPVRTRLVPTIPFWPAIQAGVGTSWLSDPFGQTGLFSTNARAQSAGASLNGDTWLVELASDLVRSTIRERNVHGDARRTVARIGPVRIGIGANYRNTRSRHEVFVLDGGSLATGHRVQTGFGLLDIGTGPYNGQSVHLSLMGGYYSGEYTSIVQLGTFSGEQPLANDNALILGGRLDVRLLPWGGRIFLQPWVELMQLPQQHSSFVPTSQWSGGAELFVRIWTPRHKSRGLYLGAVGRFTNATPSLLPEHSVALRLRWRFR